jgi:hypothetical protein
MSEIRVDTIAEKTTANGVSVDGVSLKDGGATLADNLLFNASGKGVYLGVTSATASNLLDDYEEGTWTPSVTGGVSVTTANYVKIGRFVHVNFQITATSNNSGDFSGLPFTWSGRSAGIVGYQNDNSSTWSIVTEGITGFSFRAGSTQQHLEAGEFARCSLMYMTA